MRGGEGRADAGLRLRLLPIYRQHFEDVLRTYFETAPAKPRVSPHLPTHATPIYRGKDPYR